MNAPDPNSPHHDVDMGAVAGGSGQMFDQIARRYDLLNRMMSMGLDRSWRRQLVEAATSVNPSRILDVATGTADVALALHKAAPDADVVGLDPSVGMLEVGREKIEARGLSSKVSLIEGDAQAMPFEDEHFDSCTIAFGIRNVPDRTLGMREMTRVVRPGGKVVILELSEPRTGMIAPFARFHVHHVVPRLGAIISGAKEYRYLQESIQAFPDPETFAQLMRDAGLVDIEIRRMSFGVAYLHIGTVPG